MAQAKKHAHATRDVVPHLVVYRPAVPEDLDRIAELDNELYPIEGGWTLEAFIDDYNDPRSHYIVATIDDGIVGYAACATFRRRGELTMNTVLPMWRGLGIGTTMLTQRLAWLDARVRTTILQTRVDNDSVVNGYQRHGFAPYRVLPDYYGPSLDAVEMRRQRPTR